MSSPPQVLRDDPSGGSIGGHPGPGLGVSTGGRGFPVVLTADRTLMAAYGVLLDGMTACSQTTTTPWPIMDRVLMPRAAHPGGRASVAPLGLRRVEAALLAGGFARDEVVVVDDAHLAEAIGPATRLVAISSGEPAGLGMSSSTMARIAGGEIYPRVMFRRLVAAVRRHTASLGGGPIPIVVGGPGAWQLALDDTVRQAADVDHVVVGYAEGNVASILGDLTHGRDVAPVVTGQPVPADAIPPIRGATTMGVVEISRGCGLGCDFCTIAPVPMEHLPVATILADVETNLAASDHGIALLSEDLFRYGGRGRRCEPEALIGLLEQVRGRVGRRLVQVDHANICSLGQYTDAELGEVGRLLQSGKPGRRPWVNIGIESADGALLVANGAGAKLGSIPPEEWASECAVQVRRLCRAGFTPMLSLLAGAPGETPQEVAQTLEWVRALRDEPVTAFPVLYAPVAGGPSAAGPELSRLHWQLIRECYELNFSGVARMFWDDQSCGRVGLAKRVLLQMLGKGQAAQWRRRLARHARRARS